MAEEGIVRHHQAGKEAGGWAVLQGRWKEGSLEKQRGREARAKDRIHGPEEGQGNESVLLSPCSAILRCAGRVELVWGRGTKRAVSVQNGHMGTKGVGNRGQKGCGPAGWAWASLPHGTQHPRAKGQAWDDIGAKSPKERPSGMTNLRIQTEYGGHRAESVQSPGGTREGAEK